MTSLYTPEGKPASFDSGRALITTSAFLVMFFCSGGSTENYRNSPLGKQKSQVARPARSEKAALHKTVSNLNFITDGSAPNGKAGEIELTCCYRR